MNEAEAFYDVSAFLRGVGVCYGGVLGFTQDLSHDLGYLLALLTT